MHHFHEHTSMQKEMIIGVSYIHSTASVQLFFFGLIVIFVLLIRDSFQMH